MPNIFGQCDCRGDAYCGRSLCDKPLRQGRAINHVPDVVGLHRLEHQIRQLDSYRNDRPADLVLVVGDADSTTLDQIRSLIERSGATSNILLVRSREDLEVAQEPRRVLRQMGPTPDEVKKLIQRIQAADPGRHPGHSLKPPKRQPSWTTLRDQAERRRRRRSRGR